MIPLVKDEKLSSADLGNLRPLSISTCLANIFEKVMLRIIDNKYKQSNKQFGFRTNASCSHAVYILKETLKYAKHKQRRAIIAAIDASKAFDKVNRPYLWLILFEKIGYTLTSTLVTYYSESKAYVMNTGLVSDTFSTTIGVKQGGPLSPRLFSLYVEGIIALVEHTGLGFRIGSYLVNIMLYADDIILVTEYMHQMQRLLNIVEEFGESLEIKFNPNKTNYMQINSHIRKRGLNDLLDKNIELNMYNDKLTRVEEMKYLGNILTSDLKNSAHLNNRIQIATFNMYKFKDCDFDLLGIHPLTGIQLYKTYSRTALLYGVENLVLQTGEINRLKFFESNLVKKTIRLYKSTHNTALYNALKLNTIDEQIMLIKLNFVRRLKFNIETHEFTNALLKVYKDKKNNSIISELAPHMNITSNVTTLSRRATELYDELKINIKNRIKIEPQGVYIRNLMTSLKSNLSLINELLNSLQVRFDTSIG